MKLNQKTYLRRKMEKLTRQKVESRDGMLWDIDNTARTCRVKIQGSNNLITAVFPQNIESTPSWMKIGNSVRIIHKGGNRGYIEAAGHGTSLPTTAAGEDMPAPAITPEDKVISGCMLFETDVSSMVVLVRIGSIRINNVVYTVGPITLDDEDYVLGYGGCLDFTAGAVGIDPAPATGKYRIDKVVIGDDLIIDYIKGAEGAIPELPATPPGHVCLGTVFVPCGTTEITTELNINKVFQTPGPSTLEMVIADDDLSWAELSTTITVTVNNQYGYAIAPPDGSAWYIGVNIASGNGRINGNTDEAWVATSGSSAVFTYTRDKLATDSSPFLETSLDGHYVIGDAGMITLLDSDGDPMY